MRHGLATNHFNRDTKSRKALFKNLIIELVEHGSLVTTKPRAKEIRRIADILIHKAQTDSITVRRTLHRFFGRRDVVNSLVERIAPAATKTGRVSGFTSMVAAGTRRGDNSEIVTLALIAQPDKVGTLKSGNDQTKFVKKAKVAKAPAAKPAKVAKPKAEVKAAPAKAAKAKPVAKKTAAKKDTAKAAK